MFVKPTIVAEKKSIFFAAAENNIETSRSYIVVCTGGTPKNSLK